VVAVDNKRILRLPAVEAVVLQVVEMVAVLVLSAVVFPLLVAAHIPLLAALLTLDFSGINYRNPSKKDTQFRNP